MAYLASDTIKVFPAAFRSNAYAESKRTTEENLLKFNKLSSNTANLNQAFLDPDDNTYVIFNIHGYWFRFLKTLLVGNSLKAYIKVIKDELVPIGYVLAPTDSIGTLLDDGGSFKGLEFTTGDIPTSSDPLILYYGMQVTNEVGEFISQNLKLDANEIRNSASSNKSISEEFTTETINTTDIVATGNIQASTINATGGVRVTNLELTDNILIITNSDGEKINCDISELINIIDGKVTQVSGKGLSTEDYTTNEKTKLAGLTNEITVEEWDSATKTLALSDSNKLFKCSHTDDQTLTIPANATVAFPTGTMITFLLSSTSTVTFSGSTGVTLTSMDDLVELKTQYAMASLIKIDTNTWQLVGALE